MHFPKHIPYADLLGFELLRFADGEADIACTQRDELGNSAGVVHGGAVMSLIDVAMAHAALSLDTPDAGPGRLCVTIEMKTSFMRPCTGRVVAKGVVVQRTGSMAFCEASVFDGEGTLAARASGTFKYVPRKPAPP